MALAGATKVFAFEPLPANQRALRRLCELNPQLPVNIMAVALGSEDGAALLKVMPDASMGKLSNSSFQSEITASSEVLVNVRKIDSLLQTREIPPPDVVKIDVEGAEADVLTGAREMLRVSRPRIFLEAHGGALEEACSQQLVRLGYRIRRLERHIPGAESARHLVCLP
jgi:FkbM family methyltransferase